MLASLRKSFVCLYVASTTANSFSIRSSLAASKTTTSSLFEPTQNHRASSSDFGALFSTSKDNNSNSNSNVGLSDIGKTSNSSSEETMDDSMITSWREKIELSAARSRKVRGGNYVQLATVDPKTLEPRCRTVVFRGFVGFDDDTHMVDGAPCVMKMITDGRSNKVEETISHPQNDEEESRTAEMVWWFVKSSEQYRIRGKLTFVGGGKFPNDNNPTYANARKQQWGNLSDLAREQFFWRDPATSYETQAIVPPGGRDDKGNLLPPPDNFLLMLLHPKRVDYLRLTDNFRQIDTLTDCSWSTERVNP